MKKIFLGWIFMMIAIFGIGFIYAQIEEPHLDLRRAKIVEVIGTASILKEGKNVWVPAKIDMFLTQGDYLRTEPGASVVLSLYGLGESTSIKINQMSQVGFIIFTYDSVTGERKTFLDLASGNISIKVNKVKGKSVFEIVTPKSIIEVSGASLEVAVTAKE